MCVIVVRKHFSHYFYFYTFLSPHLCIVCIALLCKTMYFTFRRFNSRISGRCAHMSHDDAWCRSIHVTQSSSKINRPKEIGPHTPTKRYASNVYFQIIAFRFRFDLFFASKFIFNERIVGGINLVRATTNMHENNICLTMVLQLYSIIFLHSPHPEQCNTGDRTINHIQ